MLEDKTIQHRKFEKEFEIVREEITYRTVKLFGILLFKYSFKYTNETNGEEKEKKIGFKK